MKKNIYFLLIVLFFSCTTIKQLKNQDIESINGSVKFVESSNLILLNTIIDGDNSVMLFDTGASMSAIFDSTKVKKFEQKKFGNLGTVTGVDGKATQLKTFTASFKNDLFNSKSKAFAYINKLTGNCRKESAFMGLIGLDMFFKNEQKLYLNFSDKTINNISNEQLEVFIKDGFHKVKSECKSNKIFIYLYINQIEYKFKFDTGFAGSFIIPFNKTLNFNDINSLEYEGSLFSTANSITNGIEKFHEKVPIKIADNNFYTTLLVSTSAKNQNVGILFIKCFDWIIDYKNNNVYLKKNKFEIKSENNKNAFQYSSSIDIISKNLIISAKQKQLNKYCINDQIISINNQKVTPENICEMQTLLNTTQNWDTLQLEVLPAKKE